MQDSRESMSVALEENRLVGRDSDESELIELVLSAKTKECISVCGLGGVGKTALVKSICQSQRLRGMFEMVAWIPMQEPFNFHEFTRTVEHKLTPNKKKILPTKRTDGKDTNLPDKSPKGNLIVLDDVSSKKDWARIKSALLEDRFNMSRVIITTREPSVDKLCERSHNLKPLRDGDALQLFRKKVNIDLHDKFSGVAIDIVKECGGLPQLIIIVAGLLQEKYSVMEWKKTRDHLTAELQNNPKLKDYDKTLTSGYKNLSSSLKSCFLYLSVFPHDSIIRRRRLVRRWTAEGYSSEKHGKSVEEVADKQFQDLMSRNMVLPCGTTISKIGNSWETYEFEFQSLMHGVSRRKSAKENLILVLDENEHSSLQAKSRARHLTVLESWDRKGKKRDALESIVHLPHLRSLTVFGKFKSFFISRKMRLLRVLDLEDANGLRDRDLSSIGKLYHLRYLSLRGSVGIFHLPDSIGYLSNLETLDIKGTMVTKLPSTIVKLQKLKYLRAGIIAYGEDDSYELVHDFLPAYLRDCFRTEHVYEEMDMKMVVTLIRLMVTVLLRGFDVCGVKAPRGIGKLKALNTLGVINVARGKNVLKEIKKLTQLRKLGITGIKKDHCEELGSTIYSCSHLQTLSLRAEGNNGLVGCLDDISPPEDLQSLKLYGNLGELPEWIGKLQRLTKLTLRSTLLEQDGVQDLGKLPTLTSLHLLGNSFKGEELNFQRNKFASLLVLEIDGLSGTKAVEFEEETMARLKLLKVNCWWNTVTDCCSFTGILHLPNLMEVLLIGLDCGESAEGFQGSDLEAEDVREWLAERKPLWDENRAFKEDLLNQLEGNQKRHILKMEY
ncbi:hypothetical protein HU200_010664 [Digitaria exilis]|uniref:NB-ARC domain-containing protein n=1 Tax=Digitaria exilis TaxID=1010633 RepID=A0A835FIL9_9POAL|nr:hypothetical protein HU200_010664 [Digitaria exilis]